MDAIKFETVDIPAAAPSRTAEPNPFSDAIKADAEGNVGTDKQALRFKVPGESHVTKDGKSKFSPAVAKLQSQAQRAANAVNRSARFKAETEGKGKNAQSVVTVWTVPKITRQRATEGTDAAATESASNPNTATG
jgi:hypothetical protein